MSWIIALGVLASVAAEPPKGPDPINPDRPDQTDGAYITPKGLPIVEMGYRQTQSRGVTIREFGDAPVVRIGFCDHFELRVSPGEYADFDLLGNHFKGMSDSALGFKWRFHDGKDNSGFRAPSFALEGNTSLPTGGHYFRSKALQPSLTGIVDWSVSDSDDLAMNFGVSLPRDNGEQFTQYLLSASWGHQLAKGFGDFIEVYSVIAPREHGGNHNYADFGFSYLLNNNVSLDTFFGSTIDSNAHQTYFGGGVSFRF